MSTFLRPQHERETQQGLSSQLSSEVSLLFPFRTKLHIASHPPSIICPGYLLLKLCSTSLLPIRHKSPLLPLHQSSYFLQQNYANMNALIQIISKTNCMELLASPLRPSFTALLTIKMQKAAICNKSIGQNLFSCLCLSYLSSFSISIAIVWFRHLSPLNQTTVNSNLAS